jgi:hypothetical protein
MFIALLPPGLLVAAPGMAWPNTLCATWRVDPMGGLAIVVGAALTRRWEAWTICRASMTVPVAWLGTSVHIRPSSSRSRAGATETP